MSWCHWREKPGTDPLASRHFKVLTKTLPGATRSIREHSNQSLHVGWQDGVAG